MKKNYWIIFFSILILSASLSHAQWRIITAGGEEYTGVFISQEKDSIRIRTLDNIDLRICQDKIKITEKMKTKIKTKRNEVFIGHVNHINEKELTLMTDGAGETIIPLSSVFKMTVVNDDVSDYYSPANYKIQDESGPKIKNESVPETKNEPEPEIEGGYQMFGVIGGFPSVVGVLWGYQGEESGIRIDGMILEAPPLIRATLIRVNYLMNIAKYKNFEHNFSMGVGIHYYHDYDERVQSHKEDAKKYIVIFEPVEYYRYFGMWYDLNYRGFFLEVGIIFSDEFPQVFPSLHVGYVYRLID